MCGIAGIVRWGSGRAVKTGDADALAKMSAQLTLRGPDDEQRHTWEDVEFVFRRLSIVDLGGGRQPMSNEDGSIVVMANGEIFNHEDLRRELGSRHTFRSRSDCEVLSHLYEEYGLDFPKHLLGMYAIAILDKRQRRLVLVRDRFGVKPLYYHANTGFMAFGSEIKALLAHPRVPRTFDWEAALTFQKKVYFAGCRRQPFSFFKGITHLPPAQTLTLNLDSGAIAQQTYWSPDQLPPECGVRRSRAEYVASYRDLLADSVKRRLMSDVEFGLFLSGGIDSVAVAALAAQHQKFHTFSVLSQSTFGNGDAAAAHQAAHTFGLPNHQVLFSWHDHGITPNAWRNLLWVCETPLTEQEQVFKYLLHAYAKQTRPGLKVILGGQGSDEFAGGYIKHMTPDLDQVTPPGLHAALRAAERKSMLDDTGLAGSWIDATPQGRVVSDGFVAHLAGRPMHADSWNVYRDRQLNNLAMYQLWHEDRTAAGNSIENRVPFLDHRLVELLLSIPADMKDDLLWEKRILREALVGIVPDELRMRPKGPFYHGADVRYAQRMMYEILRAEHDSLIEQALAASDRDGGVLDNDAVREIVRTTADDPEYNGVGVILYLTSMGVLADMAQTLPLPGPSPRPVPVHAQAIDQWDTWAKDQSWSLTARDKALGLGSVLRFCLGVELVHRENGNATEPAEGDWYVLKNSTVAFVLTPEQNQWLRFLASIDGRRGISDILTELTLKQTDIWKHLEEAVEFGVVEAC